MTRCIFCLFTFIYLFTVIACQDTVPAENSPEPLPAAHSDLSADYDFLNPTVLTLKKKLKEISGIVYLSDNQIAAIEDETGTIFLLNYLTGEILNSFEFAGKGDYEDVAVDGQYYYVLESSGNIFRVSRSGKDPVTSYTLSGKKKREFESLYFDGQQKDLIMLCKECKHENDVKEGYCFDVKRMEFQKGGCLSLDLTSIEKSLPTGTLLKPSAAAINPTDNKLYVLCSVGKSLLQCTQDGKIEKAIPLDPKLFRQPEGITFTAAGEMLISNEAAGQEATIVKLKRIAATKL